MTGHKFNVCVHTWIPCCVSSGNDVLNTSECPKWIYWTVIAVTPKISCREIITGSSQFKAKKFEQQKSIKVLLVHTELPIYDSRKSTFTQPAKTADEKYRAFPLWWGTHSLHYLPYITYASSFALRLHTPPYTTTTTTYLFLAKPLWIWYRNPQWYVPKNCFLLAWTL